MAITLTEAKAALSVYVDNGVYQNDARVIDRINEAQRRLYAIRTWLGVLAKYSLPVTAGRFTLPTYTGGAIGSPSVLGLATLMRVSSSQATSAGFLTNSEQAFLAGPETLLQVSNYVDPVTGLVDYRTYQISGINPLPAFVEVTGKLQFQPAVNGSDLLVIQDLDALRLMLLGLWREQNGQLDLAQTFETKAIERLSMVLDKTLEGARRLNYQTMITNSVPGTMGYTRARMALDLKDGLHTDDAALFHLINRTEEHLMAKGRWFGTIKQFTVNITATGEFYLPSNVDSILFASFESTRVDPFTQDYDFHENGPGYRTNNNSYSFVLVDRGEDFVLDPALGYNVPVRKYFTVKPDDNLASTPLTILAKLRFQPKQNDSSEMVIKNYPALLEMATAIMQGEKPDFFTFHENKAVELLRAELVEKRGGARQGMQIQGVGFAMGEIDQGL